MLSYASQLPQEDPDDGDDNEEDLPRGVGRGVQYELDDCVGDDEYDNGHFELTARGRVYKASLGSNIYALPGAMDDEDGEFGLQDECEEGGGRAVGMGGAGVAKGR